MANTLRFKRGLASGIPTALAGEPLFTTDTFDLYIGNGTSNTRFQKYIASGATTQILRGDGSLYTFPLAISSPSAGQVLKYNGTSWVNDSDSGITGSGSAGQVAYFSGATTQAGSNNLFWDNGNSRLGINTNVPATTLDVRNTGLNILRLKGGSASNQGSSFYITEAASNNTMFAIGDASSVIGGTPDANSLIWTRSSPLLIHIASVERARFHATGNFGIGTGATDSGQKLQVVGTGYFSDSVGIGSSTILTDNLLQVVRSTNGQNIVSVENANTGTGAYAEFQARNTNASNSTSLRIMAMGTGYTTAGGFVQNSGVVNADVSLTGGLSIMTRANAPIRFYTNGHTNERMRVTDTGNVLIGSTTDSGEKLQVTGTMKVTGASSFGGNITSSLNIISNNGTVDNRLSWSSTPAGVVGTISNHPLEFYTNGGVKMLLSASGNLGLGVTPSGWAGGFNAMQYLGGAVWSGTGYQGLNQNAFYNGTSWIYRSTGVATNYEQNAGQHRWYNAISGSANGAITFTQAMTLDASGNLQIGQTTDAYNDANRVVVGINGATDSLISMRGGGTSFGYIYASSAALDINANSRPLTFSTTGVEKARILNNGNFHIGTFSADSGEKLQVNGTAKITGYTAVGGNLGTVNQRVANFRNSGGNGYIEIQGSGTAAAQILSTANGDFYVATGGTAGTYGTTRLLIDNTGAATFYNNLIVDTNTLFVDATANEVGIGTNAPNSVLHVAGSVAKQISSVKTSNYTATASDYTILCDAGSGGFTVTLPAASGIAGRIYVIKKINASSGVNSVTVDGNASETIDGSATINLSCKSSVMLQCDGSNWHILSLYTDTSCL